MRFLVQAGLLPGNDLTQKFRVAREIGFDGVELTHYDDQPFSAAVAAMVEGAQAAGIATPVLCGGYRGYIGHFDESLRNAAVEDICTAMSLCAGAGITGIIAPAAFGMHSNGLPPFGAPRTPARDRAALLDSLRRIAPAAEKAGVTLFLEPLNRYEDHMLNTVAQVVDLLDAVGCPRFTAMIDLFHAGIEEADSPSTIARYGERIGHVHLADSNRLLPGLGHTDFSAIFRALDDVGFDGFAAFECGIPQGRDSREELAASLQFLKKSR